MKPIPLNTAILAALLALPGTPALAQANPGWFVPTQQPPAAARSSTYSRRTRVPAPAPLPPPPTADDTADAGPPPPQVAANLPQPPAPPLPEIPKAKPPPAAVIGVLSVPDVERQSSAAQAVARVIGERKERLRAEVERVQANWRQLGQQFQSELPHMSQAQAQARERVLRDRVNTERRQLQDKERIIQEAAQVSAGQIERTLINIIRQVAEAHGMNLVLHRSQVALNVQEFDITDDVAKQLNRVLPTVMIPPADVDPATLPKDWGQVPVSQAAATK